MMNILLQLAFAFGFIALTCVLTYKMTLPICLKVIELCFHSAGFRLGILIVLALAFSAVGVLQFIDFLEDSHLDLSGCFPLSFIVSGIFLFLGLRTRSQTP